MKYIGIDYGKKNIGLAISDSSGCVAMPFGVYSNSQDFTQKFFEILEKEKISEVVIGQSLNQKGRENQINSEIKEFAQKVSQKHKVHFVNEIFTSMESKWGIEKNIRRDFKKSKKQNKEKRVDDKAATMILKTFLEKKNNF
ncbi:Holliday junction resolvase RuvX [Candidatus Campbellbacteria bacterium]|nr:MAG: Holliday junction resolvase RuvX [Candidatus Campbellbacteria bacterium]